MSNNKTNLLNGKATTATAALRDEFLGFKSRFVSREEFIKKMCEAQGGDVAQVLSNQARYASMWKLNSAPTPAELRLMEQILNKK